MAKAPQYVRSVVETKEVQFALVDVEFRVRFTDADDHLRAVRTMLAPGAKPVETELELDDPWVQSLLGDLAGDSSVTEKPVPVEPEPVVDEK